MRGWDPGHMRRAPRLLEMELDVCQPGRVGGGAGKRWGVDMRFAPPGPDGQGATQGGQRAEPHLCLWVSSGNKHGSFQDLRAHTTLEVAQARRSWQGVRTGKPLSTETRGVIYLGWGQGPPGSYNTCDPQCCWNKSSCSAFSC